jgi:hypothetical protein
VSSCPRDLSHKQQHLLRPGAGQVTQRHTLGVAGDAASDMLCMHGGQPVLPGGWMCIDGRRHTCAPRGPWLAAEVPQHGICVGAALAPWVVRRQVAHALHGRGQRLVCWSALSSHADRRVCGAGGGGCSVDADLPAGGAHGRPSAAAGVQLQACRAPAALEARHRSGGRVSLARTTGATARATATVRHTCQAIDSSRHQCRAAVRGVCDRARPGWLARQPPDHGEGVACTAGM